MMAGAVLCGHDGRRGYLHHLAVAESHRRGGIGRQLVERCLTGLRSIGIMKCHLFIFIDNDIGLDFWQGFGKDLAGHIGKNWLSCQLGLHRTD
jgi:putative acetyltransferase